MGLLDSISSAAKSAINNVSDNLGTMADSILGNTGKAKILLGGYSLSENKDLGSLTDADAAKSIVFELPFNPSSIKIDAVAGGSYPQTTTQGTQYKAVDPRIQVSFTAYVDEVNNSDAFLFETINTGGGVIGIARTAYNLLGDKEYSVAAYVEGLLAALRKTENSKICFNWGKMEYGGSLSSVTARYTMFNPSGNPIKAEIGIKILCVSKKEQSMKTEWEIKYEHAMEELKSYGGDVLGGIDLSNASVTDRILG